jgi:hypothetical protein
MDCSQDCFLESQRSEHTISKEPLNEQYSANEWSFIWKQGDYHYNEWTRDLLDDGPVRRGWMEKDNPIMTSPSVDYTWAFHAQQEGYISVA